MAPSCDKDLKNGLELHFQKHALYVRKTIRDVHKFWCRSFSEIASATSVVEEVPFKS